MKGLLFLTGISLLLINMIGISMSLRSPDLYTDFTSPDNSIIIRYDEALQQMPKSAGETTRAYAIRINDLVHRSTVHYWNEDEGPDKYGLRVPIWKNYLLFLASFVRPQVFAKFEYADYGRALERGVGLCSERSIIVSGILTNNGVEAGLVGLDGHVVARARTGDSEWLTLDPDYGVVIPYDIGQIEANPELVRPYYTNENMVTIYGKEGNVVGLPSYHQNAVLLMYLEAWSFVAIWIIPLGFMAPLGLGILASLRRRR